jgi:hypothetical protein
MAGLLSDLTGDRNRKSLVNQDYGPVTEPQIRVKLKILTLKPE